MPNYIWQAPVLQSLNEEQDRIPYSSCDSDEEDLYYPPNFRRGSEPTKVIQVPSNEFRKNKLAKFSFTKQAIPSLRNRRITRCRRPRIHRRIRAEDLRIIPSDNSEEIRVEFNPEDITVSNRNITLPPLLLRFPNESQE